ncbi:hypothetical protein COCNU_04G004090 [Cocos nucifera]|uniref:Uncharacterized protein n=1 Tax=Cocos nucifera TaxID=13894 RepID=A0A8K0MZX9_COCNU|nr:hypothetical protein COCNU_04G004090 [Cocos nucifera]
MGQGRGLGPWGQADDIEDGRVGAIIGMKGHGVKLVMSGPTGSKRPRAWRDSGSRLWGWAGDIESSNVGTAMGIEGCGLEADGVGVIASMEGCRLEAIGCRRDRAVRDGAGREGKGLGGVKGSLGAVREWPQVWRDVSSEPQDAKRTRQGGRKGGYIRRLEGGLGTNERVATGMKGCGLGTTRHRRDTAGRKERRVGGMRGVWTPTREESREEERNRHTSENLFFIMW